MEVKNAKIYEDQIYTLKSDLEARRREREKAVTKFRQDEKIRTPKEQEAEFKTFWENLVKQGKISY